MDLGMEHRPVYHLDRLRMMMLDDSRSSNGRREGMPLLPLRWLRTMVLDLSHTAERDVCERLALQRRSAVGCAAERVVCRGLSYMHFAQLLSLVTHCVALLTSLDLRRCSARGVDDDFLLAVADAHGLSLRRLYLPERSAVAQSTLDRFTQLEELDATGCENLTNVDFCSATLRVLYASGCRLKDAGLRRATRLEVLHVSHCKKIKDVSPFAHCLLELHACGRCGIGSASLSDCRRLQVLNVQSNTKIMTLKPFAQRLRELCPGDRRALSNAALADATGLVSLSAHGNRAITTVKPFGASLRRLDARYSGIGDAGLVTATNLVSLNASDNSRIRSLAPFSASLLELEAWDRCLSETALSAATNLILLDVSGNKRITTVQSCSRSLRHLGACGEDCALTNEGLCTVTQLLTLDCRWNPNLTTMAPFLHSLEELDTDNEALCLEVGKAVNLFYIAGKVVERCAAELERNGFALARVATTIMLRHVPHH